MFRKCSSAFGRINQAHNGSMNKHGVFGINIECLAK